MGKVRARFVRGAIELTCLSGHLTMPAAYALLASKDLANSCIAFQGGFPLGLQVLPSFKAVGTPSCGVSHGSKKDSCAPRSGRLAAALQACADPPSCHLSPPNRARVPSSPFASARRSFLRQHDVPTLYPGLVWTRLPRRPARQGNTAGDQTIMASSLEREGEEIGRSKFEVKGKMDHWQRG
jgi:hypothetical protein